MTFRDRLEAGLSLHRSGDSDGATAIYREVLSADPHNADAHHFLGLIALQQGRPGAARELIRAAIDVEDARPTFHFNLGHAEMALGAAAAAAEAFGRAGELKPDWGEAHFNRGTMIGHLGRYAEAEAAFRAALDHGGPTARALSGLSAALHGLGRATEAEEAARRALELDPRLAPAETNLGNALSAQGRLEDAVAHHCRAIALAPDYGVAHYNLGRALNDLLEPEAALACFHRAVEIVPDHQDAWDNLLVNRLYDPAETEATLFEAHRDWGEGFSARMGTAPPSFANAREPDRPLRVGFVSADFRTHSCAYFLAPLFAARDPARWRIVAYADVATPDDMTARLRGHADGWRDIHGIDDAAVAEMVRGDAIDVLVDLSGHTRGNRLGLFARRAAPVQVSWLGYPATTGLAAMDYRLTDAVADPEGAADACHTERLMRLDGGFLCYAPPDHLPEVASPPCGRAGAVTFGSFNNIQKLSAPTLDAWAALLRQVPEARLRLKGQLLNHEPARHRLTEAFAARGVVADRLLLHGWIPRDRNPLALYNEIDVALDSFPYNGTTTTFEALAMGVPVVTMAGTRHAARVGASILTHLGRPAWIAGSQEDYVAAAASLAGDTEGLASLRAGLRTALLASPLCDGPAFAATFELALRRAWRAWCAAA